VIFFTLIFDKSVKKVIKFGQGIENKIIGGGPKRAKGEKGGSGS
jgi:hypothetical protein